MARLKEEPVTFLWTNGKGDILWTPIPPPFGTVLAYGYANGGVKWK